ncbi:MAG: tryptophan synthase subunit alpha [Nitrospirota bacterium]|nr:tryptophan synthase subunit alpha [Nitrospirota bacterium]MDH5768880.1 tryptophan synthase subunit alpha [Nitrospirota bacterium]
MTSRIEKIFKILRKENKKAFIPYIMAGDPSLEKTRDIVLMFEECGADIVELGVPFTDPIADGPTIQRASERALKAGVTLKKVIVFVNELRQSTQIPIVLMTYYNPVLKYGEENFIKDAKDAGVDGVIVPDLPPDEGEEFISQSRKAGLSTIFLLAPTSTSDRIKKVAKASKGFIYYVTITGVTGSALLLDGSIETVLSEIRKYTDKPVAVGFGVSTPEEASVVAKISDGVIVGSAIVRRLHESPDDLRSYLISLREAINGLV